MNIRSRLLKVANNLIEDIVKSFEMTEEEWKKYSEDHPNAKRENHQIVPDRKNQGGNGEKIDEQKIIDSMTDEQKKLHQKAISGSDSEKYGVSCCKEVHTYTLEKLSNDKSADIRAAVANNSHTSRKTLDKLSGDEDMYVRLSVANNRHTIRETLDKLSDDESLNVRIVVASRGKTSRETLDKLSNDKSVDVRATVAHNKQTSRETLDKLSNDIDAKVREEVAANPSTNLETLDKLINDENEAVRFCATFNKREYFH